MKNILIASLALSLSVVLFNACKHDHSQNKSQVAVAAAPGTVFACPMNCEKGKTYDKPGTCPVCNMNLEPVKTENAGAKAEYFIAFSANPSQLEAGKAGMISFTPKMKGNESAPVALELVHEKKMHLILVSDDLSRFDHIHPEYSDQGGYDIKVLAAGEKFTDGRGKRETRFEAGGKYWAFADFKPVGGLNQVDKIELNVAGAPAKATVYTQPRMTSSVDGFTVTMGDGTNQDDLTSGNHLHIPIQIKKAGKPVDPATFENYLGEKAHLVMVETASKEYVHTHPAAENGKLNVHTTFAKPGIYRGWLQFQTDGIVHTADFVVRIAEGKASGQGHEGHNH